MYTLSACSHCQRAKMLLASRGIEYEEIRGQRSREFRAKLASLHRSATAPQIVIGKRPIGGGGPREA